MTRAIDLTHHARSLPHPHAVAFYALFLCAFGCASADAAATNDVDVSALSGFGNEASGETNGWFVSRVDCYAGEANVRLSEKDDYLLSPDFGTTVRRILLKAKSSSKLDRHLAFVPWDGLIFDTTRALVCPFSPNKDTYVAREIDVPTDLAFSKFKVMLLGDATTGWGIHEFKIVTDDMPDLQPALDSVSTNRNGAVLLSSCRRGRHIRFQPNFALLPEVPEKVVLPEGWFPLLCARAHTDDATVAELSVNSGKTQYQGHYVWTSTTDGLGSYTASKTSRSWIWTLSNDTSTDILLDNVSVAFGQWNNRNTLPDELTYTWSVSTSEGLPVVAHDLPTSADDIFSSPATNKTENAQFPALERRRLSFPRVLKQDEILTLTFRDTCPASGENAALGIAGLRLLAHPAKGTVFAVGSDL